MSPWHISAPHEIKMKLGTYDTYGFDEFCLRNSLLSLYTASYINPKYFQSFKKKYFRIVHSFYKQYP